MRYFLIVFTLLFSSALAAQEVDRYVVYFRDKENNSYSLDRPEEFLSPRALARRAAQQITISPDDLPVSQAYIEAVASTGATVFYQSRWFNAILVEAEDTVIPDIKSLPMVEEVVYVAPTSDLIKGRWQVSFKNQKKTPPENQQNTLLGIPELQEAGYTGQGKIIAVFDGGFTATNRLPYFSHLFEEELLLATYDYTTATEDVFRYSAHGTKALSTIAAIDSAAFIGTAPLASFMLAVTEEVATEYMVEEYNWLFAAEWADSAGADIITSSLGYSIFDDSTMNHTYEELDGVTTVAGLAASIATQKGILVVSSAGNSGNDPWRYITTPADAINILAVGATTPQGEVASFSSVGPSADGRIKPDVVALGVQTIVADQAGGFTTGNGTSFAAPQIAGLAAAVWQAYPELTNLELREVILESGSQARNPDESAGYGVPNFSRLQSVILPVQSFPEEEELMVYPNPVSGQSHLNIKTNRISGLPVEASLFTVSGQQIAGGMLLEASQHAGILKMQLPALSAGLYFLHIYNGSSFTVHKIIKY
ncbi:S8 family serine peptidase [Nafulsella turpanensis]|uniref:S8 family serine peptidase n=1 Tax=Nafulsella turpanensis TaxID=1265690 RepID=UPI00034B711D|nr:S8 family serine peptidase [Nafulsella turpanensis]